MPRAFSRPHLWLGLGEPWAWQRDLISERGVLGAIGFGSHRALGIVLASTGLAALASALATRAHGFAAGFIALPSFGIRMAAILLTLSALSDAQFIDKPTFAISFAAAVTAVLVLEARGFKRTP